MLCDQLRRDRQNLVKYGVGAITTLRSPAPGDADRVPQYPYYAARDRVQIGALEAGLRHYEDIRDDSKWSRRVVRSEEFMLAYFDRLAQIFWKSGNYPFHATHSKTLPSPPASWLSPEQRKRMASAVVMATIAIPQSEEAMSAGVFSAENEENMRLADCLGFKKEVPTRRNLVQGIEQTGILSAAGETTQKIYKMLENSTAPLSLTARIEALFKKVQDQQDKETAAREEIKEKKAVEPDGDGGDDAKDGESAEKSSSDAETGPLAKTMLWSTLLLHRAHQTPDAAAPAAATEFGVPQHADGQVFRWSCRHVKVRRGAADPAVVREGLLSVRLDHYKQIIQFVQVQSESDQMNNQLRNLANRAPRGRRIIRPLADDAQGAEASRRAAREWCSRPRGPTPPLRTACSTAMAIEKRKQEREEEKKQAIEIEGRARPRRLSCRRGARAAQQDAPRNAGGCVGPKRSANHGRGQEEEGGGGKGGRTHENATQTQIPRLITLHGRCDPSSRNACLRTLSL